MSRTLAIGVVLFGVMDAAIRPPEAGVGEMIPRDREAIIRNQADLERRRIIETRILIPQLRPVEAQERPAAPMLVPAGVIVRQAWSDEQIEMWVFRPYGGNADRARRQLVAELAMRIVQIDRACDLSYAQKRKLRLAGRGDIKRFFDRCEAVKQKVQSLQNDNQVFRRILDQDIQPLQLALQAGLFREKSLLIKSLRHTLTVQQFARYQAMAGKAGLVSDDDDGANRPDERVAPVKE